MREIKFRAWHKGQKKMFTALYLDFNGHVGIWNYEETEIDFDFFPFLVLMQYTGLKDKNGVEIYEGDILLVEDEYTDRILDDGSGPREPWNHLAPVGFQDGSFGITISEPGDGYSRKGFWPFERILNDIGDTPEEMEIIGNIYENKELLK